MQSLWMLLAAALFALMGVLVKFAAVRYSVAEIVFFRSLIGVAALAIFVRAKGLSLATTVPWVHVRRGAVGTISLALWFYATTVLPLGTAMTLNYTSPLFLAAALAVIAAIHGRRIDAVLVVTVVTGFIGVILVLQPSFSRDHDWAALGGLISGALSAAAYWHVRELGRLGEPEWRIVFYFSLTGTALGLFGVSLWGFSPLSWLGTAHLLGVGLTATAAQLAMTRAFSRGRTLLTASIQYSAIVFASLLGVVVFDDHIVAHGWLGIAVIIGSGVAASVVTAHQAASVGLQRANPSTNT